MVRLKWNLNILSPGIPSSASILIFDSTKFPFNPQLTRPLQDSSHFVWSECQLMFAVSTECCWQETRDRTGQDRTAYTGPRTALWCMPRRQCPVPPGLSLVFTAPHFYKDTALRCAALIGLLSVVRIYSASFPDRNVHLITIYVIAHGTALVWI